MTGLNRELKEDWSQMSGLRLGGTVGKSCTYGINVVAKMYPIIHTSDFDTKQETRVYFTFNIFIDNQYV